MKKYINYRKGFRVNISYQGETIEQKVERIVTLKEPIKDGSPLIYTDRKDGVMPEYDIRTDRFDIAIDAMDKVGKSVLAKREQRYKIEPIVDINGELKQSNTAT